MAEVAGVDTPQLEDRRSGSCSRVYPPSGVPVAAADMLRLTDKLTQSCGSCLHRCPRCGRQLLSACACWIVAPAFGLKVAGHVIQWHTASRGVSGDERASVCRFR